MAALTKTAFVVLLASASMAHQAASAAPITERDRSALHAAMVQHIERQSVDGLYLGVDLQEGKVVAYSPAKSHPMLLEMGDHYILCSDFKEPSGKSVPVDFFVTRSGKDFTVFETVIGNRGPIKKLLQEGKVKSLQ